METWQHKTTSTKEEIRGKNTRKLFRNERTAQEEKRRLEEEMANVERILIVGGGIAGLTLATALHQHGFTAELVERSTA